MKPQPYSRPEIEEMCEAVAAADVLVVRVPRETLLRILATSYQTKYRDYSKPKAEEKPAEKPKQFFAKYQNQHNKRIAEYEKQHPDWIRKIVDNDPDNWSRGKNKLWALDIRYCRIQASPGTVHYYTPDKETMNKLMKALGHEQI